MANIPNNSQSAEKEEKVEPKKTRRRKRRDSGAKPVAHEQNKREQNGSGEKKVVLHIEVSQYKSLIDMLQNRHNVSKAIVLLSILVAFIFCGLTFVTIFIKHIYPYDDIRINAFGATTIQNEKHDISYWLFNTAELWANSGIQVEKGDIISIHASGSFNTAIHHLIQAADSNTIPDTKYVNASGLAHDVERDPARAKYRIFPNLPQDALVMQIASENPVDLPSDVGGNPANFYYIGKDRSKIHINTDGTLYFAINDIVLTHDIINEMAREFVSNACAKFDYQGINGLDSLDINAIDDSIKQRSNTNLYKWWTGDKNEDFKDYRIGKSKNCSNELVYYYDEEYKTAWFDDNVGSLLIVVERQRQ